MHNEQAAFAACFSSLLSSIIMKTSARNQFSGTVLRVAAGAVNDEVTLAVPGMDAEIVAIVTRSSAVELGLAPGAKAFALVKASSVIVVTDAEGARFSARNRLQGTVTEVQTGAVNSEVVIGLPGGGAVAAIITNESCTALGLAPGVAASALFKASNVIVGVPA